VPREGRSEAGTRANHQYKSYAFYRGSLDAKINDAMHSPSSAA
jgi:hypothetical protein